MTVEEIEEKFNEYQTQTVEFVQEIEADDPHLEFIESLRRLVNK